MYVMTMPVNCGEGGASTGRSAVRKARVRATKLTSARMTARVPAPIRWFRRLRSRRRRRRSNDPSGARNNPAARSTSA